MSNARRARWITDGLQAPRFGALGVAVPAGGYSDPDSCEQGAYLFIEDGQEDAAYCDPKRDLEFLRDCANSINSADPRHEGL